MRRLEYRTPVATLVFAGMVGVALLAGCVALIVQGMTGQSGSTGEIIIGFIVLPLALYFVVNVLRPAALTADDTGLRLRRAFGIQRVPWAAIRGFRMVKTGRAGPRVQAILHTGEMIWLPNITNSGVTSERIVAELTAALSEHAEPFEPPE